MNLPMPAPASPAAPPPPGPGFSPPSPASPPAPPAAAAAPPPARADLPLAEAYQAIGDGYAVHGGLELLTRRLDELLDGHAALVAHITDQAPAASSSTPGGAAFWGQVLDRHAALHGLLKAAVTHAGRLLVAHGNAVEILESLL